jgi:hypothetical protein
MLTVSGCWNVGAAVLAINRYFENPAFLNYLQYLKYWKQPQYAKYIVYVAIRLQCWSL